MTINVLGVKEAKKALEQITAENDASIKALMKRQKHLEFVVFALGSVAIINEVLSNYKSNNTYHGENIADSTSCENEKKDED